MILYLCEKPSQARDIGRVLGVTSRRDGYLEGQGKRVTWCIGHLLEMTTPDGYKKEWKTWSIASLPLIPENWELEVTSRGVKQFKIVKELLKEVSEVVLATDADREGETIGREVLERCRYRGKISRLWLSALDDASIRKALGKLLPGEKTEPLYRAGLGRARADWLVGMNLTRAYTILGQQSGYDGVLTVGRVQTPTLKLVVDRDRLIENFKPVEYFEVIARLGVENGEFKATWVPGKQISDDEGRCLDKNIAAAVAEKVRGQSGRITKTETKQLQDPPPLPLELSTLQQEASRRWGMSAKKTLQIAQALYEKYKVVTYPRTDCRFLPMSQFGDAPDILQALASVDASLTDMVKAADTGIRSKAWNDKKVTAHHAIIPTLAKVNIGAMSRDELLLYDLIRRHYLAQFFSPFKYDRTVIIAVVEDEAFRTSGRVEKAPGWKRVLPSAKKIKKDDGNEEQRLPLVTMGEPAAVKKVELEKKHTKPPARYTEGTLIQAMKNVGKLVEDTRLRKILRETAGIGTEATRAAILENLLKRKLLANEGKKNLISMAAGRALVDVLPHSVTDPATTAVWEQALDDIAHAEGPLDEFLGKSVTWISKLIANVKVLENRGDTGFSGLQSTSSPKAPRRSTSAPDPKCPCPQCGKPMCRRKGGRGWFMGCSNYPACKATMPDKPKRRASKPTSEHPTGVSSCPKCDSGDLVERTVKKGPKSGSRFMGCNNFPKCRYTQV